MVLYQGPGGQSAPLQRQVGELGADVRRVRLRRPLFEFHRLGKALLDREHNSATVIIRI
ncbi:MAG: hypothetical protein Q8O54_04325 [Brevundimonas sp.]|nr:hypothetical protein [Brevundimonas sp.]